MSEKVLTRLERASNYLAIAESDDAEKEAYRRAAELIAAHKADTSESNERIGAQLRSPRGEPRSGTYVGNVLKWLSEGCPGSSPHLMNPRHHEISDNAKAKRVVRERPDVIVGAIRELPAEQQAQLVAGIVQAAPEAVGKGLAAADRSARVKVGVTADRELRYPGMSDVEVQRARQLEHRNREEVHGRMQPVMGAFATLGATGLVEQFEQLMGQLREAVEGGATFTDDQLARLDQVAAGIREEATVLRERAAMASL